MGEPLGDGAQLLGFAGLSLSPAVPPLLDFKLDDGQCAGGKVG